MSQRECLRYQRATKQRDSISVATKNINVDQSTRANKGLPYPKIWNSSKIVVSTNSSVYYFVITLLCARLSRESCFVQGYRARVSCLVQGYDKTATCCVLNVLRAMHMFLNFFSSSNKISCMWPVATSIVDSQIFRDCVDCWTKICYFTAISYN